MDDLFATRLPVAQVLLQRVADATNHRMTGDRTLASTWKGRASDNVAAIRLMQLIEQQDRPATPTEQDWLMRFTGFGASDLANGIFTMRGKPCRAGWEQIVAELRAATTRDEWASLQRATQYAHYTPEFIIRAMWQAAHRFGFRGGTVLEAGCGTGLFWSLMPDHMVSSTILTGIENDPVTARIARLLHPKADIRLESFTDDGPHIAPQDLVIGNPPFSDRTIKQEIDGVRGLSLHEFFIARALRALRPGGIGCFVVSRWMLEKDDDRARVLIEGMADFLGAIRLPAAAMRAAAGTDVVVDLLFFRRRAEGAASASPPWTGKMCVAVDGAIGPTPVNAYFAAYPAMVLGRHAIRSSQFGMAYTCLPDGTTDLACALSDAVGLLGSDEATAHIPMPVEATEPVAPARQGIVVRVGTASDGATVKEGSYLLAEGTGVLMQVVDSLAVPVPVKSGRGTAGMFASHAAVIRGLIPVRDAVRDVLRAQEGDRPWEAAQDRLSDAYGAFVRKHGPINKLLVSKSEPDEDGDVVERSRRPNIAPMMDDPDCWLVAAIEDYDADNHTATRGPIFTQRVISPPPERVVNSAADALAIVLNECGGVNIDRIAYLTKQDVDGAIESLGDAIFLDPATGEWQTDDAYLSGPVRSKLAAAEAALARDPAWKRNVDALRLVQPADLNPTDITARLGAPWIPAADVMTFIIEVIGVPASVVHTPEIAAWSVGMTGFTRAAAATSEWGTARRHAGLIVEDALNNRVPAIYDYVQNDEGRPVAVLNAPATEAVKEKLAKVKDAFTGWVWRCDTRADRLARIYNDLFNNLVDRHFSGVHLMLPGASGAVTLRAHQRRGIWRIITSGGTYLAHTVGSGKTFALAAAVMEQRRLGLVSKPMLTVPGHCLAQFSREFVQLYPNARILVADETNFSKAKRHRFLARAATGTWDCIIITHSAFKFISVPTSFERGLIQDQLDSCEALLDRNDDNKISRKRIEAMKEALLEKLNALRSVKDNMLTLAEIGVDQIIVDEAQQMRKLSFFSNMTGLRGIDPNGSQRAWDLFVKARFVKVKNPRRPLILSSGTPITNTVGEMYTLQRFMQPELLDERGVAEFDAWALTFGDTRTELELQPSGLYKPITRFSQFVNVPELVSMFRQVADVVQKDDLRQFVTLPVLATGQRQLVTAPASPAFKAYQAQLARRIKAIEARGGKPKKGEDILLSVITDGRHAAIDMRLVGLTQDEPGNKLNALVDNAYRIWKETAQQRFTQPNGQPYLRPGAAQMIFSDLGTLAVESTRGFSAYRWIKERLVAHGVPASEIAFMQEHKTSTAKQRLFDAVNAGVVRFILGSSETMGTGVNVQQRLKAMHHLDVPWLPSQIEQREGRIERQGNQNTEVAIYAYATLGSLDATMWQTNERKARFIAAVLAGDRSIRKLEDLEASQANQFAMAKAIASGDARLMQKAGLEAEIARLQRQASAHHDDQHSIRSRVSNARDTIARCQRMIPLVAQDIAACTAGEAFEIEVLGKSYTERAPAGAALLSRLRRMERDEKVGDTPAGHFAGFPLTATGTIITRYGERACEVLLTLDRAVGPCEVAVTDRTMPATVISRLEYIVDGLAQEMHDMRERLAGAEHTFADYLPRLGATFGLQAVLDAKLDDMDALDRDLAATRSEAA